MEINSEIEVLKSQMKGIDQKVEDLTVSMNKNFDEIKEDLKCHIRREEFAPVKAITYGFVGIILTTVVGALLILILK